jgi:hypothetical protein
MEFTVRINCENAAFDDALATETARILRGIADSLESGQNLPLALFDSNGNQVGRANFEE